MKSVDQYRVEHDSLVLDLPVYTAGGCYRSFVQGASVGQAHVQGHDNDRTCEELSQAGVAPETIAAMVRHKYPRATDMHIASLCSGRSVWTHELID